MKVLEKPEFRFFRRRWKVSVNLANLPDMGVSDPAQPDFVKLFDTCAERDTLDETDDAIKAAIPDYRDHV